MILFSALTLANLRSNVAREIEPTNIHLSGRQIRPIPPISTGHVHQAHRYKYSNQFIVLSLLQVLTFALLNTAWASFRLFNVLATPQTTVGVSNWGNFVRFYSNISLNLIYTYGGVSHSYLTKKNVLSHSFF